MAFSLHGVHLPHRKNTANTEAVRMPAPEMVTLPTSMHIGAPATPVVKAGDHVDVGTLVAEAGAKMCAPIYATVSGTVKKIDDYLLANGRTVPAVVIESDGAMTVAEGITPPVVTDRASMLDALRKSGIVGLGGAGFPTHLKFDVPDPSAIKTLLVNGAECEPYITSDSVTMVRERETIGYALGVLMDTLGIPETIIAIEKNKPAAIAAMKAVAAADSRIRVKVLPTKYPQGGEKVLVYHTVGAKLPAGALPLEAGCVVCNTSTIAAIGNYLRTGMPLVERCVTVDGSAVAEPKNVLVPIGTALADVFAFCGGYKVPPQKILYGGPMMGVSVPNDGVSILKNTNAILAFDAREARLPEALTCIRCGECMLHCPVGLNPAYIGKAYHNKDTESLERLNVNMCMECGCCAYVCPAHRDLVQNNRLAKDMLRKAKAAEEGK